MLFVVFMILFYGVPDCHEDKKKSIARQSVKSVRYSVNFMILNDPSFRHAGSYFLKTPGVWQAQKRPGETS